MVKLDSIEWHEDTSWFHPDIKTILITNAQWVQVLLLAETVLHISKIISLVASHPIASSWIEENWRTQLPHANHFQTIYSVAYWQVSLVGWYLFEDPQGVRLDCSNCQSTLCVIAWIQAWPDLAEGCGMMSSEVTQNFVRFPTIDSSDDIIK